MSSWFARNRPQALTVLAIGAVVVATVVSRLHVLRFGEIDWDEGVYWLSMQSMRSGHPLFVSVYSSQPPAFLLFTEPLWALLGGGIAAARAVMLAWGAVAVIAGGVIGWRLGGRVAAVVAAVTLAVDPIMIRQSVVLQADGPATALGLVSVALAAVAITTVSRRWSTVAAGLAGAALALGFLTKFLDIAVVPALLAVLAGRGAWRRLLPAAVGGGLLAAAALLLPLHDAWQQMWNQAIGLHIDSRSATSGLSVLDGLQLRWHLAVIAVLGGVVGWRRHPRLVITGVLWLAGAVLAMAITHPLWNHHAVAVSPGYALLCAAGVSSVFAWLRHARRRQAVALTAAFGVAFASAAAISLWSGFRDLPPAKDFTALAAVIRADTSPSRQLVGDEQFAQALANRPAPPGYVDTSNTRLYAEPGAFRGLEAVADGAPPVCAVVFSSGRFAQLPGFAAWVSHRYPVTVRVGVSQSLHIAPGCART
jgi:4-amino-4-deoxy-L-arabinose transferase-like glycosyltransferase